MAAKKKLSSSWKAFFNMFSPNMVKIESHTSFKQNKYRNITRTDSVREGGKRKSKIVLLGRTA
jgi:hypothetical protein